jgi:hypothetical protein
MPPARSASGEELFSYVACQTVCSLVLAMTFGESKRFKWLLALIALSGLVAWFWGHSLVFRVFCAMVVAVALFCLFFHTIIAVLDVMLDAIERLVRRWRK